MPEYVGAELQFEAVGCFEALARRHDTCIVDEDVERPTLSEFARAKGARRSKAREIQPLKLQPGGRQSPLQAGEGIVAALFVTAGAAGVESGHKPAIRMRADEIEAFADGAEQLLAGRRAFRPAAFSLFETWQDVRAFARSAFGRDLLLIVQIVDERGTGYLRALARRFITPRNSVYDAVPVEGFI